MFKAYHWFPSVLNPRSLLVASIAIAIACSDGRGQDTSTPPEKVASGQAASGGTTGNSKDRADDRANDRAKGEEDIGKQVEQLAVQLDADKESERDQAEEAIYQFGPQALDYLPAINEEMSAEQQMRIERLREKFKNEAAVFLQEPKLVKVVGRLSPLEALEALAKQTGNKLSLKPYLQVQEFQTPLELELQGVTYWEAIDELLELIGWRVSAHDGDQVRFVKRQENQDSSQASFVGQDFQVYVGALRIEPISVSRTIGFQNQALNISNLDLMFQWEPRIKPMFVGLDLPTHVIRTDDDELLAISKETQSEFVPTGNQIVASFRMRNPENAGKQIADLKGKLNMVIPGRLASVEFSDLGNEESQKLQTGDLQVELESARKNRDVYEIRLGLSLKSQPSEEILQGWVLLGNAFLVDSKGTRVEHAGWSTHRWNPKEVGVSFLFDIEGDLSDYRFVYRAPESVVEQTIEYSLRNIPLP